MAQLEPWIAAQTRDQLAAVAWLRWRIFVHSFRTRGKKRGVAGWVVIILLRIIAWAFVAGLFVGPVAACGFGAYYAAAHHQVWELATLTWAVFTIGLFVSINISPQTLGFNLTPLIRFPISFRTYLLVRLFFGFFAIPTVVSSCALAAAAIGIGIADPVLFPWAALVMAVFALHNVFFLRMVFAWVDRWMSTRRAREIMGGVVLFISLGFQLFAYGGSLRHGGSLLRITSFFAPLHIVTQYLPPSLVATAIASQTPSHRDAALAYCSLAGVMGYAVLFLTIFALRLRQEFRGENLSEASARAPRQLVRSTLRPSVATSTAQPVAAKGMLRLPSTISACLEKEWIYLKRSGAQLYGLITPLFIVFILTRRNSLFAHSSMMLPYAVAYVLFGLLAQLYNVLGADGAGFSLYLLAPIRLRDVFLTKNLLSSTVIVTEILLACIAVSFILGGIPPAAMLFATLSWAAFALLANLTVGNLRSLLAPMHYVPGKSRKPATAKGSGLISLTVLAGTLIVGVPTIYFCHKYNTLWLATLIFVVLGGCALAAYLIVLGRVDDIALNHRDDLIEALCKT